MSEEQNHSEWLSLLDISGPFLSAKQLAAIFPMGLDRPESAKLRELRLAYHEWRDGLGDDKALHQIWVDYVLLNVLEYPQDMVVKEPNVLAKSSVQKKPYFITLEPTRIVLDPHQENQAKIMVMVFPSNQKLDKVIPKSPMTLNPKDRILALCQDNKCTLGVVTNGEDWTLAYTARGETSTFINWHADLWMEDPVTFYAFFSLLCGRRLWGVKNEETLSGLMATSRQEQQEVTNQLGTQVRKAVEILVESLDRADLDRKRALLEGVEEQRIYEAALTIMTRLVFLLYAEEQKLLPIDDPFYAENYAISTLRLQLRETANTRSEGILERRQDAWCRLLATFRMVYEGCNHQRLRLRPYGGNLFDPDRFPFLEGRLRGTSWKEARGIPLPINNRTVLYLLEALQLLKFQKEIRRVSFQSLDVEQIGYVYEGLLERTARRAQKPMLALLCTKGDEIEIDLDQMEKRLNGDPDDFIKWLKKLTGRSPIALNKALTQEISEELKQKLALVCEQDETLIQAITPFVHLLRTSFYGEPLVFLNGSLYVTTGQDRRSTGTQYTQRVITEPIVKYTLEPLVYQGPREGWEMEKWKLQSAKTILELKVCDPAAGSGAFLAQICRYLADRLLEAWQQFEKENPNCEFYTPEGQSASGLQTEHHISKKMTEEEKLIKARRLVCDRCLYGVDLNPLAVEIAKLSLWLITMDKNRPFTFLNHALRHGDSLLGITHPDQLIYWNHQGARYVERSNFTVYLKTHFEEAYQAREELHKLDPNAPNATQQKQFFLDKAEACMEDLVLGGNLLIGSLYKEGTLEEKTDRRDKTRDLYITYLSRLDDEDAAQVHVSLHDRAKRYLLGEGGLNKGQSLAPFHWCLMFPEVFLHTENVGFDAIVGNPPYLGGQKITGTSGEPYREFLVEYLANEKRGSADLCAYFLLRTNSLLKSGGMSGLVMTNTIAQGNTREVGLDQITEKGSTIIQAIPSRPWPGEANLEVAYLWMTNGDWQGGFVLDEKTVKGITSYLMIPGKTVGNPFRLKANKEKSYQGSIVLGQGFVLEPDEAHALITKNSKNKEILFPYLNGEDLNSRPDQSPSRWVINFQDWPLKRDDVGTWAGSTKGQKQDWLRSGIVPNDYPDPVAEDYPDCLQIAEEKVKPERETNNYSKTAREKWWLFERSRPELYNTIKGMKQVVIRAQVSKTHAPTFLVPNQVFSMMCIILVLDQNGDYSLIQSNIHEIWARTQGSTLETRMRYTPSDCFETFPFPENNSESLSDIGQRYYEHRQEIMQTQQEGLTKTYNRFHNPEEESEEIQQLRELHVEMDQAVAQAYGWEDLELGHGFHETKQGIRYTVSEEARQEILDRLLALNHERHEVEETEEQAEKERKKRQKELSKKKKVKKEKPEDHPGQMNFFEPQTDIPLEK